METIRKSKIRGLTPSDPEKRTSNFPVRGVLPWHNFLCGPSTWDEEDYAAYLDEIQALGINAIAFHCYTGGVERYAPYVEPFIRIEFRNVVPLAGLDTSLTARWGARPMRLSEFAYDCVRHFSAPEGHDAFGARCALLPKDNEERYAMAKVLLNRVIGMAHARGIAVGLGFEFGIHPPELASVVPPGALIGGAMLPDPTHPANIEILHLTIDDILASYPELDQIWMWLHEHTMHVGRVEPGSRFVAAMEQDAIFAGLDADARFNGVWALAYANEAIHFLDDRGFDRRIVLAGWGDGVQLPAILRGLDAALPRRVTFACLNPGQGIKPHPPILAEVSKNREAWAIPWLEGDYKLWHPQPAVEPLRRSVLQAHEDGLQGVFAIHWRTADARTALHAFTRFIDDPENTPEVLAFYREEFGLTYGAEAAEGLAPLIASIDLEGVFGFRSAVAIPGDQGRKVAGLRSPEFFAYEAGWGRLPQTLRERVQEVVDTVADCLAKTSDAECRHNLEALGAGYELTLLLDDAGRSMQPAEDLRNAVLRREIPPDDTPDARRRALASLEDAPLEALFAVACRKIRSKGDLGVVASMNQRLYRHYLDLRAFCAQ